MKIFIFSMLYTLVFYSLGYSQLNYGFCLDTIMNNTEKTIFLMKKNHKKSIIDISEYGLTSTNILVNNIGYSENKIVFPKISYNEKGECKVSFYIFDDNMLYRQYHIRQEKLIRLDHEILSVHIPNYKSVASNIIYFEIYSIDNNSDRPLHESDCTYFSLDIHTGVFHRVGLIQSYKPFLNKSNKILNDTIYFKQCVPVKMCAESTWKFRCFYMSYSFAQDKIDTLFSYRFTECDDEPIINSSMYSQTVYKNYTYYIKNNRNTGVSWIVKVDLITKKNEIIFSWKEDQYTLFIRQADDDNFIINTTKNIKLLNIKNGSVKILYQCMEHHMTGLILFN